MLDYNRNNINPDFDTVRKFDLGPKLLSLLHNYRYFLMMLICYSRKLRTSYVHILVIFSL